MRPRCRFKINFCPKFKRFGPHGRARCEAVEISSEEAEALRLKNILGLDQTKAAHKMNVSQSTFQRILTSAYKKVSEAIIYGKEINIIETRRTG